MGSVHQYISKIQVAGVIALKNIVCCYLIAQGSIVVPSSSKLWYILHLR